MKKLVLTATITLACVAAFAQGKVRFVNDSLHWVYFTTDTSSLLQGDSSLAGQPTPANGVTPAGTTLAVELWAGTSAASLAKVATTAFSGSPGTWTGQNVTLPFAGGAPEFFQVLVYDGAAGSYAAASTGQMHYYGESPVFTSVPSSGTAYFSIVQTIAPAASTWAVGSYGLDSVLAGAKGSIMLVANVPEPTTVALAGLGAAALLIFRRRK